MNESKKKVGIVFVLLPVLISLLFSMFGFSSFAASDMLKLPLSTPDFYQGSGSGMGNYYYSIFAYDYVNRRVDRLPISYASGLGAYYLDFDEGEQTYPSPGGKNRQEVFDTDTLRQYSVATILPDADFDELFVAALSGIDSEVFPINTRFYYMLPQNSNYLTYLFVTRMIYNRVLVPETDLFFKVEYYFDYIWDANREGANELYPYLEQVLKPLIKFTTSQNDVTVAFAEPSTLFIDHMQNRTYRATAYFEIPTDDLVSMTSGYRYDYMQLVIAYPAMLSGARSKPRTWRVDAFTDFPEYYTFLGRNDYAADLLTIQDLIDNQTGVLTISTPADDEKLQEFQDHTEDFALSVEDYLSVSNSFDSVVSDNTIQFHNPVNLLPAKSRIFISTIGDIFQNSYVAPMLMVGFSFILLRMLFVRMG